MDYAILANLLLFLGALGASFAIDQSGGEEQEDDTEAADTAGHPLALPHDPSLDTGEDSLAADRDTLAWFLNGDDAPLAITGAEGGASFSGTAGDDLMAAARAMTACRAMPATTRFRAAMRVAWPPVTAPTAWTAARAMTF